MWRVREPFYTQVINWVNTILDHIDTRTILPRNEGFRMVYPNPIKRNNTVK